MRKFLLVAALLGAGLLLQPAPLVSQTTLPRVLPNTPITLEWDHSQDLRPGGNGTGLGFRILVNGTVTKTFLLSELTVSGAVPNLVYRGTVPGVATGTHSLVLRAYDTTVTTACTFPPRPNGDHTCNDSTPPLQFEARVTPLQPGQPRIIITALVGGIQIELQGPRNAQGQRAVAENVLRIPGVQ